MSIKTEIDRIKQSKADIILALKLKGVTVPSDASIDDLSALVEAIEVNTSEDLSSELTTQNNLITTQETTIDNIISALQGKASGGSGGVTLSNANVTISNFPSKYVWYYNYFDENTNQLVFIDGNSEENIKVLENSIILIVDENGFGGSVTIHFSLTGSDDSYIMLEGATVSAVVVGTGSPTITYNN